MNLVQEMIKLHSELKKTKEELIERIAIKEVLY